MTRYAEELDTATAVLAAVRSDRAIADAAEARLLQHAVAWAAMHSVDSIEDAATMGDRYGDTGMPVAGEGAPLVAEFAITEFAAAIGVSTDAGKRYVGERSSCATGSPGCGAASSTATSGRGTLGGSPTRPCSSHRKPPRSWTGTSRRWRTRSAPCSWSGWWTRRSRPYARPGRGTTVGEGRRPVLHGRAAADLLRRHGRRCTASWTWPTRWIWSRRWPASPPSSRTWVPRAPERSPRGRGRGASPPQLALPSSGG